MCFGNGDTRNARYHRGMASNSSTSLPVVNRTSMSRVAKRRLWVLLTVQVLIIAHVLMWWLSTQYGWFGGYTLSPIEPSESIETVSDGIVNAGAIFFATALLSTALLGRWFCGWGCHVLLLQDGCTWLLKRAGIRPRAFRSRLLMLAPLALALYMFVWPLAYRFLVAPFTRPDLTWPGFSSHLLVRDFWATFPGVTVAVFFLGICGVLTVYMLGSKGFCTYGCPYGGFFAPLDRLAPVRIRVNDNCQGCAECTAVCTSNVRVHEEVATHGMVIDNGCMKTMDCIEACPNDALSMSAGPNAAGGPRPKRTWDLTWPQEFAAAALMLVLFLVWRGAWGVIPMLMAMGTAACGTWLLWRVYTMVRSDNAKWLKWQLKRAGKVQGKGWVVLAVATLFTIVTFQNAVVQASAFRSSLTMQPHTIRHTLATPIATGSQASEVHQALEHLAPTMDLRSGGWAIVESPAHRYARARLLAMQGKLHDAHTEMVVVMAHARPTEAAWRDGFALHTLLLPEDETQAWAEVVLADHPDWGGLRTDVVAWLTSTGRASDALDMAAEAMSLEDARRLMLRAVDLLQAGRAVEALPLMQDYVNATPKDTLARAALARLLLSLGHTTQAGVQMQRAISEGPNLPPAQQQALAAEVAAFNAMAESKSAP